MGVSFGLALDDWLLGHLDSALEIGGIRSLRRSSSRGFQRDGVSYYVILDRTQPEGRFGISEFHSEKLGLFLTTRASYAAKNALRFHIAPRFNLPHPFRMVRQEELDKIYNSGQTDSANGAELKALLQESWGVITL